MVVGGKYKKKKKPKVASMDEEEMLDKRVGIKSLDQDSHSLRFRSSFLHTDEFHDKRN